MERSLCDPNNALKVIYFLILAYVMLLKLLSPGTPRAPPAVANALCPECAKAVTATRATNGAARPLDEIETAEEVGNEDEGEDKAKEENKTKEEDTESL